jgi:predicted MFS family arabinose efflux permease
MARRAVGTYRLWRDSGFAVGALLAGVLADAFGLRDAIGAIAAVTAGSGLVVLVRMYETLPRQTQPRGRSAADRNTIR